MPLYAQKAHASYIGGRTTAYLGTGSQGMSPRNISMQCQLGLGLLCVAFSLQAASRLDQDELEAMRAPPKASTQSKVIRLGPANERAGPGNDSIVGSNQNDRLAGGGGDDWLNGGAGDDELSGQDGDDYLIGAEGNDVLIGGAGNDRYRFDARDGVDKIDDVSGRNTLMIFAAEQPMVLDLVGDEYLISYGSESQIRMSEATFDTLQFLSVRILMNKEEFIQMYGRGKIAYPRRSVSPEGKPTLTAGPLDSEVNGTSADEIFVGGPGDDVLIGGGGNDEFRPGTPSGALAVGGIGNDVYVFNRDDGRLMIGDEGGTDTIKMGAGIELSELVVTYRGGDLILLVADSAQAADDVNEAARWSIRILRVGDSNAHLIERIVFATGEVLDGAEVYRNVRKE